MLILIIMLYDLYQLNVQEIECTKYTQLALDPIDDLHSPLESYRQHCISVI